MVSFFLLATFILAGEKILANNADECLFCFFKDICYDHKRDNFFVEHWYLWYLQSKEQVMHMSRRNENVDSINVIPRGPVFLSYRHSDGTELAVDMAWALRAAGIPVWLDRDDLPPGDTERHLDEAMQSGLSGAVLLVTPDIGVSTCIKDVELPRLLALEATGLFTLSIGSTIKMKHGGIDYCGARPTSGSVSSED